MVALPLAGAAPGDLTLASTSSGGTKGLSDSLEPSLSSEGTTVAFHSFAPNLDPNDPDTTQDVYVKDLASGAITLASTSSGGTKGNSGSAAPSLSADGTKVAFYSSAWNLDPNDPEGIHDVFVKDLVSGALTLASTSSIGLKGNSGSFAPSLSADGTKVAFLSTASNLNLGDTDTIQDVFVKDLVSGVLTLASSSEGTKANNHSFGPSLSPDGTKVAFYSGASNLDPGDTDPIEDVYVKDLVSGALTVVSTSSGGNKGNNLSGEPTLSVDGTKIAFRSFATNLDPSDIDSFQDVYVKDLMTGTLTLVSSRADGHKGNNHSQRPSISEDGTKVAFDSLASNLDLDDPDGLLDMYVKDLVSGTLAVASTSSTGTKGNFHSSEPSLSADGAKVAFHSQSTNLDPVDSDTNGDIYVKDLAGGGGSQPVTVTIKIKRAATTYTVTVITTPDFEATTVDAGTVCFGDAEEPGQRDCSEIDGAGQLKDADRDGDLDMLLQFEASQTGIDLGDAQACLSGETTGGTPIEGCGAIKSR
jgi:Tol biopolymer transport system component